MRVEVYTYNQQLDPQLVRGKTAVVIDLFRATSVITTALANGAREVIPTCSKEEAFTIAKNYNRAEYLLGGEERMQQIPGFDYGNSPQDYTKEVVAGKTLIMSTTNGTKAIRFCDQAAAIYICSMLNCKAVATELLKQDRDIVIICAGLRGDFALEDAICADMLRKLLGAEVDLDDLEGDLTKSRAYQVLSMNGFVEDINFCLQSDIYGVVPKCIAGRIII